MLERPELKEEQVKVAVSIATNESSVSPPPLTRRVSPIKILGPLSMIRAGSPPEKFKKLIAQLEEHPDHQLFESRDHQPKLLSVVMKLLETMNNESTSSDEIKKSVSFTNFKEIQRLSADKKPASQSIQKLHKIVNTVVESNRAKALLSPPKVNRGIPSSKSIDNLHAFTIENYDKKSDGEHQDYLKHINLGELAASLCEIEGRRWEQQDSLQYCKITNGDKAYNAVHNYNKLNIVERADVLIDSIDDMQKQFGTYDPTNHQKHGGTTANATAAWVDSQNILHINTVNVGDSTSFYVILDEKNDLVDYSLINKNLHKPNDPEEEKRITAAGGFVRMWGCARLDGCLALARALGDCEYEKSGLSHAPEFWYLDKPLKEGHKAVIITSCDGLTEKGLDTAGIAKLVSDHIKLKEKVADTTSTDQLTTDDKEENVSALDDLSKSLVSEAFGKKSGDNISVGAFILKKPKPNCEPEVQALCIFDGHGERGGEIANNMGNAFFPTVKKHIEQTLKIEPVVEQAQSLGLGSI